MSSDIVIFLAGLLVSLIGGAIAYGRQSEKTDQVDKRVDGIEEHQKTENQNLWKVISDLRSRLEEHFGESGDLRITIEKDLSKLREAMGNRDGKLDAIIEQLGEIKRKIDRLEARP